MIESEYDDELFEWTRNDMLEVLLPTYDDFLKIKETLTRIGVASKIEKILYPSCYVLHKKGKYYIMNFKELFCLDGRQTNITWNDIERRNTIATLLQEWGLLKIVDETKAEYKCHISNIKIIPHKEKYQWKIQPKYTLGKKRGNKMNFKEQTGIKTKEGNEIGRFISFCFEARTKSHIAHLKTRSFSEHMALNVFYTDIIPLADAVAEAYQGKYGLISNYPDTYLTGNGIEIVRGLKTWIDENRNKICSDSNIQNEIDNVLTLCDSTIYKLEFLN